MRTEKTKTRTKRQFIFEEGIARKTRGKAVAWVAWETRGNNLSEEKERCQVRWS